MTTSRRQAREVCFQFLYSTLPQAAAREPTLLEREAFRSFCANFSYPEDPYAWEVADGVGKNLPSIDATVAGLSANWRVERMPKVDLTLLRLAVFEIQSRKDIPKSVAINEAVELAKKFGGEDSPSFVNGILDKIDKPS